ncbi:PREDICTED: UBP1-associated proteins 1A isoform X2 [Tarenaya hassleriana]|uniref:UBP1-associated proteins 1A isoform X2 n=1 Tax=Tarenaya hassleriana TaxID=28532 RepID=UPI0008FD2FD7|nr:PREDICTED: UBP1-associated proteins 1A isoform X2 [Tarenaya hassleriana]
MRKEVLNSFVFVGVLRVVNNTRQLENSQPQTKAPIPKSFLAPPQPAMVKTLDKSRKRKRTKPKSKKIDKKNISKPESSASHPYSSADDKDSDSESGFDPAELRELLQPYSKEQLVDLVCSAAEKQPSIFSAILDVADCDVTHRKIFVYGLPWETTRQCLLDVFERYGEIEECNVVMDKATGKAKGFAFVLFKSSKGAKLALKEPKKKILNRTATCQLASMGPAAATKGQEQTGPVKINLVQQQQPPQGQQVLCGGVAVVPSLLGQHPGLNLVYGSGLLGDQALGASGGYMYPVLAGALSHGAFDNGGFGSGFVSGGLDRLVQTSSGGVGGPGGGAGLHYLRGESFQSVNPNPHIGKIRGGSDQEADGSFPVTHPIPIDGVCK